MLASSASGIRISPGARLPGPTAGSPRPRRPGEPNVLAGVGLTHVRSGTNETASLFQFAPRTVRPDRAAAVKV
jgi:hypothetical protein